MPGFHLRFVGRDVLPKSLSARDVEESFGLSADDLHELKHGFRGNARIGAAYQLVMLRATGRAPDALTGIPKALLAYMTSAMGMRPTDIASLASLYKDAHTSGQHKQWARERAGFSIVDEKSQAALLESMHQLSSTAISVDDLVKQGELWLFARRNVLPSDRTLRDLARQAFAAQEAAAIKAILDGVPASNRNTAIRDLFSKRPGPGSVTVLEWLRTPPGKHGRATLKEIIEKIQCIKKWDAEHWKLQTIPLTRLRAYSQEVVGRAPSDTKRLSEQQQALQLCAFIYITLLDLNDLATDVGGRCVNDLNRKASGRVMQKQAGSAIDLRAERVKLKSILHDTKLKDKEIVAALRELLPKDEPDFSGTRASMIRESLVNDDAPRVTALLNSLSILDIRGAEDEKAMQQLNTLRSLADKGATTLPDDFDMSMTDPSWHNLLGDPDRKKALAALKACAMNTIRKAINGGKLWIAHSTKHQDKEQQLIPPKEWEANSKALIRALSLTDDPDKYLERVLKKVDECIRQLCEAVKNGLVTIDNKGEMHIDPIQALEVEPEVTHTRDALFNIIGARQYAEMLVEIDAKTGLSEALLGRRAKNLDELKALYGALFAHGTENTAKGVCAMIPGLQVSQITSAMRAMEAQGRLRDANNRVIEFQQSIPIASLWGSGEKASADAMTIDTSRHLHSARVEHRRKTHGVGIYVHMSDTWSLFYDQPIVLNDRQAGSAVHGVEAYNVSRREDQIRLQLLAVDTHGYTNAAMSIAKLLGFDLCVRLQRLSERKIYLPWGAQVPEDLERLQIGKASLKKIREGWDGLLRLIASIRQGKLTARDALARLGSAAKGDPVHAAADELGKLLRTIFLCDYFTNPDFRREMHALLNRGESVHFLQRAVYHGRVGVTRARRSDELMAISGAHTLLTNVVIAWNTMKMQEVVDFWRMKKHPIEDNWIRRMGPVHFEHINFRGIISFNFDAFEDTLLNKQSKKRAHAAA
ncbi:MAG: Tn3 family transposase [Burkholderiales bacterium]|nr:MAG: Tn3 family transposase [Burkholderiales bacterium]